jgi:hypothetical protein
LYHSPRHQRPGSFIALINRNQSKIEEGTGKSEEKRRMEKKRKEIEGGHKCRNRRERRRNEP